jgi:nicotinamide riboside kinase
LNHPKLICLLGAESTGKTTLARQLAAHFDCPWVPEVLRSFCDERGRTPTREEQSEVLETQHLQVLAAQAVALQNKAPFVFCDTAPLLTAVYSDFVFGDRSLYARARELHASYGLTLLMAPDIEWVADGLQRDGAHVRAPVSLLILSQLQAMAAPFSTISGQGEERLKSALQALI